MFNDRAHAGSLLAQKLPQKRDSFLVVLGLARGGVVVAGSVADKLGVPFDLLVVKKIPSPENSELAMGAVAPDSVSYMDWQLAQRVGVDEHYVKLQITNLNVQIKQKNHLYRKGRLPLVVKGKTVIVVDDGAATGATMQAAVIWLKKKKAAKIIIGLPVAPAGFVEKIKREVDELVVLETPRDFFSVGQFYNDFPQVSDNEVIELLQ